MSHVMDNLYEKHGIFNLLDASEVGGGKFKYSIKCTSDGVEAIVLFIKPGNTLAVHKVFIVDYYEFKLFSENMKNNDIRSKYMGWLIKFGLTDQLLKFIQI